MEEQTSRRRRIRAGLAVVAAGALGVAAALPASASVTGDGEPFREVPGDPTCEDIQPAGADWTELEVDSPSDGPHTDGTLEVELTINDTPVGHTLDWTSNIGVDAVIVKGGPNANVYEYDPEATEDTGLHAPPVGQDSQHDDISRVSFCYDDERPTPIPPVGRPELKPEVAPPVVAEPTFTG